MVVSWEGVKRTIGVLALAGGLVGCGSSHSAQASASLASTAKASSSRAHSADWDGNLAAESMAAESMSEESMTHGEEAGGELALPPSPTRAKNDSLPPSSPADDPTADAETPSPEEDSTAPSATSSPRPLLIYQAHLALAVFHTQENIDTIEEMANEAGGYLVSRSQQRVVVRVPAAEFQDAVAQIVQMGDIRERRIAVQDVTAQFTDLKIRLKNALAMRERLQQLLDKAQKVEEALAVEQELSRITEQIERMKGRLKLFRELIAFSTIQVDFVERQEEIQSRVQLPFPWLSRLGLRNLLELQ